MTASAFLNLPAPLVPANVDLRDMPVPRDLFARMAVDQFGMSIEEARAIVDSVLDTRVVARRKQRGRHC